MDGVVVRGMRTIGFIKLILLYQGGDGLLGFAQLLCGANNNNNEKLK